MAVAVALATVATYAVALGNAFVGWDDPLYVTRNPLIVHPTTGSAVRLLRAVVADNWHPLTMLSLWANAALSGTVSARPYVVTNVLLHALTTALVYVLAERLTGRRLAAVVAALLFGLHPMHVESVAWISERKDVLYAALFVAACLAALRRLDGGGRRWLAATYGLFVLACLAKAMAVVFPVVLLLLAWWRGAPHGRTRAMIARIPAGAWAAFAATSLLVGVVAIDVQAGGDAMGLLVPMWRQSAVAGAVPLGAIDHALLIAYGFWRYLAKLAWPAGLAPFYPYPTPAQRTVLAPVLWASAAGMVALAAGLAWAFRRQRAVFFGLAFFIATIAPVLQVLQVGRAAMADRYTYVSSIGLFLLVGLGVDAARRRSRGAAIAALATLAVVVACCVVQTRAQIAVWHDSESLWTPAVRLAPRSADPYRLRGGAILDDALTARDRGEPADTARLDRAIADFTTARALDPTETRTYGGLGIAYSLKREPARAVAMLDRAIALDTANAEYRYDRALAELELDPRRAIADFDAAARLDAAREGPQLWSLRGYALAYVGEWSRARADFDGVVAAGAANEKDWFYRGLARWRLGDPGAPDDVREALRLRPDFTPAAALLQRMQGGARGR